MGMDDCSLRTFPQRLLTSTLKMNATQSTHLLPPPEGSPLDNSAAEGTRSLSKTAIRVLAAVVAQSGSDFAVFCGGDQQVQLQLKLADYKRRRLYEI